MDQKVFKINKIQNFWCLNNATSFLGIVHHYLFGDKKSNWKVFDYFQILDKYFVDYILFRFHFSWSQLYGQFLNVLNFVAKAQYYYNNLKYFQRQNDLNH